MLKRGVIILNNSKYRSNLIFSFILFFGFLVITINCGCNTTEPTPPKQELPDTTSHSFTWQTFEFGDDGASPSSLKDVAIINDSDIWAVGSVYLNDSTGQPDPLPYNLLKWNGKGWELRKVSVEYNKNQTIAPLTGIFILQDGEIILSSGLPYLPNGNDSWKLYHLWDIGILNQNDGSVFNIWGTTINNLYFAGNKGTIVNYKNNLWTKQLGGTNLNLTDIWGNDAGSTIWACGYAIDYSQSCILKFDGTAWKTIWKTNANNTPPYGYLVSTIWAGDKYLYAGAGDGIYRTPLNGSDTTKKVLSLQFGPHRIRGSAENNIAVAVDDGSIWHYNGATWFQETPTVLFRPLYSISVSENTIVGVGFDATNLSWKGLIVIGRRN